MTVEATGSLWQLVVRSATIANASRRSNSLPKRLTMSEPVVAARASTIVKTLVNKRPSYRSLRGLVANKHALKTSNSACCCCASYGSLPGMRSPGCR